jgi:hypothetical protein
MSYRIPGGEFMADWYDAEGKRHRRRFKTKIKADRHEWEQSALAKAEACARQLDKAPHHAYQHKGVRAELAKRAAAIITIVPA